MKNILMILLFGGYTVFGQANIVNICNSHVYIYQNMPTISEPLVSVPKTNKVVVLPLHVVERLRWEEMLQQRRIAAYRAYLRRFR